jgi:hypothetical protein
MAREAGAQLCGSPANPYILKDITFTQETIEHLVALVRADERSAPVHDENQAFIDSLPADSDDKMYMQIHHWARQSYARHKSLVAGQMITAGDASDTHIIWATLRWAKENTPPAAPAPVQEPESFEQWNAKQHGDPEEIGFLQALRIAYCAGQDSVTNTTPPPHQHSQHSQPCPMQYTTPT